MGNSARARNHIPNRPHLGRTGFTLTELVVCLAVIAILSGLTFPAVQKARAAAQRSTCLNNLRQLGAATHNYEQAHGSLPLGACAGFQTPPKFRCFSAQAKLLPFLEQAALANAIDWTDESADFPGMPPEANATNHALLTKKVSVFLCPADANAEGGAVSYRQSVGWNFLLGGNDPLPKKAVAITDGLSHTALFSERLVGGDPAASTRNPLIVSCGQPTNIVPACAQAQLPLSEAKLGDVYAGATWLRGSNRHARYAHMFPPNSRLQDCLVAGWVGMSLMTARSAHAGGVNLLFADGHATFVTDQVGLKVWRAWGSPNGGEPAP
jgi:prepilin-type N-terminal cleavage/methylation domain-containing protein/prepilin-type processing-associated H-X9-DG protein